MSAKPIRIVGVDEPTKAERLAAWRAPPIRNPIASPEKSKGVQLKPIPWGKRDPDLGRLVCRHIEDANPPIFIRYNPITHSRLSRLLRSCGVHH